VDTQAAPLGPSPLSVHRDAFTVALWVPLGLSPFYVHFDAQGFTVATRAASLGPLLVHRNAFMVVARTPLGRPPFSNGVHGLWVGRRSFQSVSSQPSKERRVFTAVQGTSCKLHRRTARFGSSTTAANPHPGEAT
jgi:hypothetical protein